MTDTRSRRPGQPLERLGAALVLVLLTVGCFALWIGVPTAGMWLAGQVTDSFGLHMPLTLAIVLLGMTLTAIFLVWLNQLYLRITGRAVSRVAGLRFRRRGPLEPLLIASLVIALIALFVWFFLFAENPSRQVI